MYAIPLLAAKFPGIEVGVGSGNMCLSDTEQPWHVWTVLTINQATYYLGFNDGQFAWFWGNPKEEGGWEARRSDISEFRD